MGSDFTISKEKHIKYILDNFDFVEVNRVMTILDWQWWGSKLSPTINELKNQANKMLNEIYNEEDGSWSETGGFRVTKFEEHLELLFIITDYSSRSLNLEPEYKKLKEQKNRKLKLKKLNEKNN